VAELPAELQTLGGLTQIDEIVLSPDDGDVYLIGPGEDAVDVKAEPCVGDRTGRPLIRMEDWLVVLRTVADGERQISCSIDPDPERLRAYNAQIQATAGQVQLATAGRWYANLAAILGKQDVAIRGVPLESRTAAVLAKADFSMKRIALGVDPSGVREIKSQLALAGRDRGAAMQRWWFAPLYEPVEVDAGRTRFHLSGPRVQLLAQEELIGDDGQRQNAATTHRSSKAFAKNFTEHFERLAEVRPVFGEMRNLFDVAVAATIVVREQFPRRAGWTMSVWLDQNALPTPVHVAPKFVESASTIRRVNETTVVGLVGGVTMNPGDVLRNERPGAETASEIRRPEQSDGLFVWVIEPE
jgi:hypothetical protein